MNVMEARMHWWKNERDDDRPCGRRGDREDQGEVLTLPKQPRDPLKAAARAYCEIRHSDASKGEGCKGEGQCFFCQDTVARVIRAYNSEALTKGE